MSKTDSTTPSTRHRRLRTAVLTYIGLCIALLLSARADYLRLPTRMIFFLLLTMLSCPTVFWWSWMDEWFASMRRPASETDESNSAHRRNFIPWIRTSLAIYSVIMLAPMLMVIAGWRHHDALPVPLLMWLMTWHLSVSIAGIIGLCVWLPYVTVRRIRSLSFVFGKDEDPDEAAPAELSAHQLSRRAILSGAITGAPILLSGATVAAGLNQQGKFIVRRIEMKLPRLPQRLRGLTITHVSDFHVGRLFRPEHLGHLVEETNKLKSDLIAVTGDMVDHSADYFPVVCDALAGMESRYGRYVVIGNHDLIDSPRQAVDYLTRREPRFLVDKCLPVDIGGEQLRIAGLFWSRYDRAKFGVPGHLDRVEKLMSGLKADVFTLALAHHPHAFDALADVGVDLTLAGHTHGGQIMATPPGSDYPIGGGNLLFRYIWGEYRRGNSAMYVNSGVGNWFPVRINAPAEIVQLRLV